MNKLFVRELKDMNKTILLCDDDFHILKAAEFKFKRANHDVLCAGDGEEAWELIQQQKPDLLITDCQMPQLDGIGLVERIRAHDQTHDIPVIMLTAKGYELHKTELQNRLKVIEIMTKPFSPRELVARVEAILRRRRERPSTGADLRFAHLLLRPDRYEAWAGERQLDLTQTEYGVLLTLARHAGRVLSRDQLLDHVWGNDFYGNERVVDVYVGQVRRKLEEATGEMLIQTVRGVGYKFVDTPA